jgi:general secretion pathway protein N
MSRWAVFGAACGLAVGAVAFVPAAWLADAVASASGQRLLLADARGTAWRGSAVPVLSAGPDSRSAALLPGRLTWSLGLSGAALRLTLRQPCCIADDLVLLLRPGFGGPSVQLPPGGGVVGVWPAAWLSGLGAPWNSLQLGGTLRLASPGLTLRQVGGIWRLEGRADLHVADLSSPLATLGRLGSYALRLEGQGDQPTLVHLSTQDGALQLAGTGQWTGAQFRFRGEARAASGFEGALDHLLNLLGRRQGAVSVLSIG